MTTAPLQESLEWFFNDASTSSGLRSNFDAMVRVAQKLNAPFEPDHSITDGLLENVDRIRHLERALATLSKIQQDTLWCAFRHSNPPEGFHVLKVHFGDTWKVSTYLAHRRKIEPERLRAMLFRLYSQQATPSDTLEINLLQLYTTQQIADCVKAFSKSYHA